METGLQNNIVRQRRTFLAQLRKLQAVAGPAERPCALHGMLLVHLKLELDIDQIGTTGRGAFMAALASLHAGGGEDSVRARRIAAREAYVRELDAQARIPSRLFSFAHTTIQA